MPTNLYEALNLSRDFTLEEINNELTRLELIWHKREINQPEKAHKILALIDEARLVFKTELSRTDYDKELVETGQETINQSTYPENISRWINAADEYFSNAQYDLAEAALEKVIFCPEVANDDDFFILAGSIYLNEGKFDKALECINNAIVINPDNCIGYGLKGIAYHNIANGKQRGTYNGLISKDRTQLIEDALLIYDMGIKIAQKVGNSNGESEIQGYKAFLLYSTKGKEAAHEALEEAMRLGDSSGYGQRVMNSIEEERKNECHYTEKYYPCAPINTEATTKGRFYWQHGLILNEVENTLIQIFLNREIEMKGDSYEERRNLGGISFEDGEVRIYNWNIPNEGKIKFHLKEYAEESFNDGGYASVEMTYDGSNAFFSQIQQRMKEVLSILNEKDIAVLSADEIRSMKETRIEQYRKSIGRCPYCGGEFKGLFTIKCSECGKVKNY